MGLQASGCWAPRAQGSCRPRGRIRPPQEPGEPPAHGPPRAGPARASLGGSDARCNLTTGALCAARRPGLGGRRWTRVADLATALFTEAPAERHVGPGTVGHGSELCSTGLQPRGDQAPRCHLLTLLMTIMQQKPLYKQFIYSKQQHRQNAI